MNFENTTVYNKSALMTINFIVSRTSQKLKFIFHKVFFISIGIFLLVASMLLTLVFNILDLTERIICISGYILGVLSLLQGIFLIRIGAWNSKRMMVKGSGKNIFNFTDEYVEVETPNVNKSIYNYDAFVEIYETEKYFVFMLDKKYSLIVDKNGFDINVDIEDFKSKISEKTNKNIKFIKCKIK